MRPSIIGRAVLIVILLAFAEPAVNQTLKGPVSIRSGATESHDAPENLPKERRSQMTSASWRMKYRACRISRPPVSPLPRTKLHLGLVVVVVPAGADECHVRCGALDFGHRGRDRGARRAFENYFAFHQTRDTTKRRRELE
jgi:hypothetical protein